MALTISFFVLGAVVLLSALAVVLVRNVFRAGLSLLLCFFSVAGIYITLGGESGGPAGGGGRHSGGARPGGAGLCRLAHPLEGGGPCPDGPALPSAHHRGPGPGALPPGGGLCPPL